MCHKVADFAVGVPWKLSCDHQYTAIGRREAMGMLAELSAAGKVSDDQYGDAVSLVGLFMTDRENSMEVHVLYKEESNQSVVVFNTESHFVILKPRKTE